MWLLGKLIKPLEHMGFLPGSLLADLRSAGLSDHFALHLYVDFYVNVSGIEIGMTQPVTDHVNVISRTE